MKFHFRVGEEKKNSYRVKNTHATAHVIDCWQTRRNNLKKITWVPIFFFFQASYSPTVYVRVVMALLQRKRNNKNHLTRLYFNHTITHIPPISVSSDVIWCVLSPCGIFFFYFIPPERRLINLTQYLTLHTNTGTLHKCIPTASSVLVLFIYFFTFLFIRVIFSNTRCIHFFREFMFVRIVGIKTLRIMTDSESIDDVTYGRVTIFYY